jgi:hypothetical protein
MKKFLLIFLFITSYGFAQNSGITYQAVIYNPNGEELPGVNNPYAALTEQSVCLQFGIVDASGTIEYQENVQVTTDVFGMVNLLIGTYPQTSGYAASFSDINWGADAKFLKVDIDINGDCTNFKELSNQPFTYVPFAYYSPASDTPGPAGEDGNGIVNTIKNTDNTITFEYTDGTSFTTDSLNGEDGGSGLSAYEVWIGLGNTGTEQEFIDSLTGPDGETGLKSLINTSEEPVGPNCDTGGTKIEVGIDINNNSILENDEVDNSLTRFICDGVDGVDGVDGQDGNISGIGGDSNSNSVFLYSFNSPLIGGNFSGQISGDGNFFSGDSFLSDGKAYIHSVTESGIISYPPIISPNGESDFRPSAFNYDGSIAVVLSYETFTQYFFQLIDGNYQLMPSLTNSFSNLDNALLISKDNNKYATYENVYKKNLGVWELEGTLNTRSNPYYSFAMNHLITGYAYAELGDYDGLNSNGKITIVDYNNGISIQKGNEIYGIVDGSRIGQNQGSLAIDESINTIAFISFAQNGSTVMDGEYANVYKYDENTNQWNQKGQTFEAVGTKFQGILLSEDGNIVTLLESKRNGESGGEGNIKRYEYNNNVWTQIGSMVVIPFEWNNGLEFRMEKNTIYINSFIQKMIKKY